MKTNNVNLMADVYVRVTNCKKNIDAFVNEIIEDIADIIEGIGVHVIKVEDVSISDDETFSFNLYVNEKSREIHYDGDRLNPPETESNTNLTNDKLESVLKKISYADITVKVGDLSELPY